MKKFFVLISILMVFTVSCDMLSDTSDFVKGDSDPLGTPISLTSANTTTQMIGRVAWNTQALLNKVWINR